MTDPNCLRFPIGMTFEAQAFDKPSPHRRTHGALPNSSVSDAFCKRRTHLRSICGATMLSHAHACNTKACQETREDARWTITQASRNAKLEPSTSVYRAGGTCCFLCGTEQLTSNAWWIHHSITWRCIGAFPRLAECPQALVWGELTCVEEGLL